MTGEFDRIARLTAGMPDPPAGETWVGDDAAVVRSPGAGWELLAVDSVVEGVHADLRLVTVADLGWRALVANLSDVAAMGGDPWRCVVSVAAPGGADLDGLYRGLRDAAGRFGCPIVGGDMVASPTLVVTVAVTGTADGPPVLRSGARPGDAIWVTGPFGGSAAGLRLLRQGGVGGAPAEALVAAHRRPLPRLAEGTAARRAGATAMIDVSDGFAADLWHVARRSGVGFALDEVPTAAGARPDEALGGGEDYELVFCAPPGAPVADAFAGLRPPHRVGVCTPDAGVGTLAGRPLPPAGWQHW